MTNTPETINIIINPELIYYHRDEALKQSVTCNMFGSDQTVKVGMQIKA